MKKLLSIILVTAMLSVSLSACGNKTADNEITETVAVSQTDNQKTTKKEDVTVTATKPIVNVKKTLSPEEIVELYMKNEKIWAGEFFNYSCSNDNIGIFFVDLDFDGISELVVSYIGGSGSVSENDYYKIDKDKIIKINVNRPNEQYKFDSLIPTEYDYLSTQSCIDPLMGDNVNLSLYKNKKTGEKFYYGYDFYRCGINYNTDKYGKLIYAKNNIEYSPMFACEAIWKENYIITEENEGEVYDNYFYVNTNETSKENYDKAKNNFESENINLNLKSKVLFLEAFLKLDSDSKREKLLSIYNSVSYDN